MLIVKQDNNYYFNDEKLSIKETYRKLFEVYFMTEIKNKNRKIRKKIK